MLQPEDTFELAHSKSLYALGLLEDRNAEIAKLRLEIDRLNLAYGQSQSENVRKDETIARLQGYLRQPTHRPNRGRPSPVTPAPSPSYANAVKKALPPVPPGKESVIKLRRLLNQPGMSKAKKAQLLAFGTKKAPQVFCKIYIRVNPTRGASLRDRYRKANAMLAAAGIRNMVRTFSFIGNSLIELYVCGQVNLDVAKALDKHQFVVLREVDICAFTKEADKTKTVHRLAVLYAREKLVEMRKAILRHVTEDIRELVIARATEIEARLHTSQQRRYDAYVARTQARALPEVTSSASNCQRILDILNAQLPTADEDLGETPSQDLACTQTVDNTMSTIDANQSL
jgi:hypothetical protein